MANEIKNKLTLKAKQYYQQAKKVARVTDRMETAMLAAMIAVDKLEGVMKAAKNLANSFAKVIQKATKYMLNLAKRGIKNVARGLKGLTKSIKNTVYQMGRIVKSGISKTFNRLEISLNRLATVAKRVGAVMGALFVAMGKFTAEVQDIKNAFTVVFGDATKEMEKWADKTGKNLRRSVIDIQNYMKGFKSIFKPYIDGVKLTEEATNKMSQDLTKLTIDMASFKGAVSDKRAFNALKSGLIGNTKALRRLDVDLTQATVNQYLLKEGIDKTMETMTFSEKVYYRYMTILENTNFLQGDASRTAEDLENTGKALASVWKRDVTASFGRFAAPAMGLVLNKLIDLGHFLIGTTDATKRAIIKFMALATVGSALVVGLAGLVTTISVLTRTAMLVISPISMIAKIFGLLGGKGIIIAAGLFVVGKALYEAFSKSDIIKESYEAVKDYFGELKTAYKDEGVVGVFDKIKKDIEELDKLKLIKKGGSFLEDLLPTEEQANKFGKKVGTIIKKVITSDELKEALKISANIILEVARITWNFTKGAFSSLTKEIREKMSKAFKDSINNFMNSDLVIQLKQLVNTIQNWFGSASDKAKNIFNFTGTPSDKQVIETNQTNPGGIGVGSGYANGGYTGNGTKFQPAGIVHKGEYVIPQSLVKNNPEIINQLEGMRKKGYANGGNVGIPMYKPTTPRYDGARGKEVLRVQKATQKVENYFNILTNTLNTLGIEGNKTKEILSFVEDNMKEFAAALELDPTSFNKFLKSMEERMNNIVPDLQKKLEYINKMEILLGDSYDANSAKLNAYREELRKLVKNGTPIASEQVQNLTEKIKLLSKEIERSKITMDTIIGQLRQIGSMSGVRGVFEEVVNGIYEIKQAYDTGKEGLGGLGEFLGELKESKSSGYDMRIPGASGDVVKGTPGKSMGAGSLMSAASSALSVVSAGMTAYSMYTDYKQSQEEYLIEQKKRANKALIEAANKISEAGKKGESKAMREAKLQAESKGARASKFEDVLGGVKGKDPTNLLDFITISGAITKISDSYAKVKELDTIESDIESKLIKSGFTASEAEKFTVNRKMGLAEKAAFGFKRGSVLDVDATEEAMKKAAESARAAYEKAKENFSEVLGITTGDIKSEITSAFDAANMEEFRAQSKDALNSMIKAAVIQASMATEGSAMKELSDYVVDALTNTEKSADGLSEISEKEKETIDEKTKLAIKENESLFEVINTLFDFGDTVAKVNKAFNELPSGIKTAMHRFSASETYGASETSGSEVPSYNNGNHRPDDPSYKPMQPRPDISMKRANYTIDNRDLANNKGETTVINLNIEGNMIGNKEMQQEIVDTMGKELKKIKRRKY